MVTHVLPQLVVCPLWGLCVLGFLLEILYPTSVGGDNVCTGITPAEVLLAAEVVALVFAALRFHRVDEDRGE